jgi:hypothetical protein
VAAAAIDALVDRLGTAPDLDRTDDELLAGLVGAITATTGARDAYDRRVTEARATHAVLGKEPSSPVCRRADTIIVRAEDGAGASPGLAVEPPGDLNRSRRPMLVALPRALGRSSSWPHQRRYLLDTEVDGTEPSWPIRIGRASEVSTPRRTLSTT